MASKLCDSCKSATATLFCRPDAAFLCLPCDANIHAANKLVSRHPRFPLCDVCEQAPAHVTCKADAASLCVTCDQDIHSANPLARRHDRIPITPFYDSPASASAVNFLDDHRYFSDAAEVSTEEEAEAASWLLKAPDLNSGQFSFPEIDPVPYSDHVFGSGDPKIDMQDGVVPVKATAENYYDMDFSASKHFTYNFNSKAQCVSLSNSVSSSSMEVGVVPEGNPMSEISNCVAAPVQISAAEREARVLRYREKRKNRRFEKTIRYASRKAYAETRPRIKGRFAKRVDVDVQTDEDPFSGYGVVPAC